MTKVIGQCLFLILFMTAAISASKEDAEEELKVKHFSGNKYFSDILEFFYMDVDRSSKSKELIKEIATQNGIDDFFYLFVSLAKEHPIQFVNWLTDAQIKIEEHSTLIHALEWSGLKKEAIKFAQKAHWSEKAILSLENDIPSPFLLTVDFPGYLPWMYNGFCISGDLRYIKKIIDAIETDSHFSTSTKDLRKVKEGACHLIRNFILNHEKIYQLCLKEAKTRKGDAGIFLNQLLEDVDETHKHSAFPERNGMFNGFIFVTDDPNFEEEWVNLPTTTKPTLNPISSIPYPKENKIVKIFIMFNSIDLDKDLNGHVTYDLEIINPQGKKVKEFHNMSALNKKVPSRFFLQASEKRLSLEFCPDKTNLQKVEEDIVVSPGVYIINAIVKDHISGKDLKLTKSLEILPLK